MTATEILYIYLNFISFFFQMNTKLITYLVGKGGSISAEKNTKGDNPLHLLAQMCMKHDMASLVKSLNTEVW